MLVELPHAGEDAGHLAASHGYQVVVAGGKPTRQQPRPLSRSRAACRAMNGSPRRRNSP
jgi:hypothetical protein